MSMMSAQAVIEIALKECDNSYGLIMHEGFRISVKKEFLDLFINYRNDFINKLFNYDGSTMCKISLYRNQYPDFNISINAKFIVSAPVTVTGRIQCTKAIFTQISSSIHSFDAKYFVFINVHENKLTEVFENVKFFKMLNYYNNEGGYQPNSDVIERSFPNMEGYNNSRVISNNNALFNEFRLSYENLGIKTKVSFVKLDHPLFHAFDLENVVLYTANECANYFNGLGFNLTPHSNMLLNIVQKHERIVLDKKITDFNQKIFLKNAYKIA